MFLVGNGMQETILLAEMIEQISAWSAINSGSWNLNGLQQMQMILSKAFSCLGGISAHYPVKLSKKPDLLGTRALPSAEILTIQKRPKAPLQLLLIGHLDTVFDINHPFQSVRKMSDRLYGPGVADMKGGLCLLLQALKIFETLPESKTIGWKVVITPDEEIGSSGSMPYLLEWAPKFHAGLVFEPAMNAEGSVAYQRKGSGNFVVFSTGKAAHAGRAFNEGQNAIVGLATLMTQIHALNTEQEGVTINIGRVIGGEADNAVPAHASCTLDIRISRADQEAWFKTRLASLIAAAESSSPIRFKIEGKFGRPPKLITPELERLFGYLDEAALAVGQSIDRQPSGGCCDGNNLLAQAKLPNIDTLGVCGGNLHSDQEYCVIPSLLERLQLIVSILKTLARHEKDFHVHTH
jgi:glutamate carboxypeptidase